MNISPTRPEASGIRTAVVTPLESTLPPPTVPRMPIVDVGVTITIALGSAFAIWPLTKVNDP